MNKKFTTLCCLFFLAMSVFAQSGGITGKVLDGTAEPLIGASIVLRGTTNGTITSADGLFSISGLVDGSYTLEISYVGFSSMIVSATVAGDVTNVGNITLKESALLGDQVVISGSKIPEKLVESPATIVSVSSADIEDYAGGASDLLSRLKGVEYARAGVVGGGINVRGFNNNFNSKNLLMTDGRNSSLIATGLPYGPLNTTIQDDIERVEVILGPNSTMYGPNAHNGLVNIITKDPRTSQGTSVVLGVGNQSTINARFRHANKVSDKFAFKVMGSYTSAEEFEYTDSVYVDTTGDNIKDTAFPELGADTDIKLLKAEAQAIFTPTAGTDLTFSWGHSNSSYLSPTNVGRNRIEDWKVNYYQLKFSMDHFFAQVYYSNSKTDKTFSIDSRTTAYIDNLGAGMSEADAIEQSSPSGTLFEDNSKRVNAELQYNNKFGDLEVISGLQYQKDMANSNQSYLLDGGKDIVQSQIGGYAHLTYSIGDSGWKILGAARVDNHEIYGTNFVPKAGILKIGDIGTWRLTYGKGIAAPTIFNLYADVFNGVLLGNSEGFTLSDGTKIAPQVVEKIQTFELGYRGQLVKEKLFFDANAYYNISEDFLSAATNVSPFLVDFATVVTHRGDVPISDFQAINGVAVLTYINFGKVDTYGFDLGLNYYLNGNFNINFNYSYFDVSFDEDDLDNDFDGNEVVDFRDILPNAPNHKAGLGLNFIKDKFSGTTYFRWVESYDYFSGFQVAAATDPDGLTWREFPIVADARGADTWNYGALGGFVTIDLNMAYKLSDMFTVSGQVTNLLDGEQREFTASPPTGRLMSLQVKARF